VPNDAKLGMVVGVGLVIVVAVLFVRRGPSTASPAEGPRAVTPAPRMSGPRGSAAPVRPANRTSRAEHAVEKPPEALAGSVPGEDRPPRAARGGRERPDE
jgi:hypothetical protein